MSKTLCPVVALLLVPNLGCCEKAKSDASAVNITVSKEHIEFQAGKDLVARYHIAPSVAKPYLWPLNGPGGVPVTRAVPIVKGQPDASEDHLHQKSAWFCHGDVIPEGMELKAKVKNVEGVDFWSENARAGKIVCTRTSEQKLNGSHGQLTTHNEWRTVDGTKILDEIRTIHLYDFGNTRLLVFDIDLHASVVPITFGDTKEGSFGVRVNDEIREAVFIKGQGKQQGKGKLENADGKIGGDACQGRKSKWCDYSGPIAGKTVGIAILDDPTNPVAACWMARPYGLMAANPFGRDKAGYPDVKGKTDLVKLAKGEHLKLRYGILIHPGDAKEGKVAEYYEKFTGLKGK